MHGFKKSNSILTAKPGGPIDPWAPWAPWGPGIPIGPGRPGPPKKKYFQKLINHNVVC